MQYSLSDYLTTQFYLWEQRGRGWYVFSEPIELEPEFIPFFGHILPERVLGKIDYGRRPRFFPKLQEFLGLYEKPKAPAYGEEVLAKLEERYPVEAYRYESENEPVELEINFGRDTRVVFEHIEQLILMLGTTGKITSFEVFGTGERISVQFVSNGGSVERWKSYINAYVPGAVVTERQGTLLRFIDFEKSIYVTDLGLRDEFMRPLRVWTKFDPDPLSGCIAALEALDAGEFGMLQVLFQATINPWAESTYRAVSDGQGGSFFLDAPEMLPSTKEKLSAPLFAVVIRAIGQASTDKRAEFISEHIAKSLVSFRKAGSNSLMPLDIPLSCTADDLISRRSRRIGMFLNSNELASIVHIPDRSILSPKLRVYAGKTKRAPRELEGHTFELGVNSHLGQEVSATLSEAQRLRHMHIIGATGTGKSSLLLKLITEDIKQGRGVAVLDPHGDLIDAVIEHLPETRLRDVILVDPSDSEYPIGLNLLSALTDTDKIVLSSDLVALFRRFSTSWGDQMTSVLSNAINAILESKSGGTLIDLRRFLVEPGFRNKFLETIDDPSVGYYWRHEFPLLRQNSIAPILTRLDTFLRPQMVRNMMAQKDGLDFSDILEGRKILLVKLAQGLIGEENSFLLGTLFVAKLHQAAQLRQNVAPHARTPFYFYVDEFQNFVTPSMSAILSGARKYGLGLILAHQDLDQLSYRDPELMGSVLANPYIRVCFRCGEKDAAKLEGGFSYFDATDLQSLGIGEAIVRVGQKDHDFNLSFSLLPKVDPGTTETKRTTVISHCREVYAVHRSEVENILKEALQAQAPIAAPTRRVKEKKEEKSEPIIPAEPLEVVPDIPIQKADLEIEAARFVEKEALRERQREHRYIQEFIKRVAEARNFKAVLEEPVNDGAGKVDVSLHRDGLKIACEISVTNTAEYEVENIRKCLQAGYLLVFMVSNDLNHLNAIRNLAVSGIEQSLHNRIFFVSKDEFVTQLDLLLVQQAEPQEVRTKGYRVKVNYSGSQDIAGQEKALRDVIVSAIRRGKDKE